MEHLIFNEETHEYTLDGKKLISVTQLMRKHGLAPNYDGVSNEVLKAKAERGTLIHKEIENFCKHKTIGFTEELAQFINAMQLNGFGVIGSELQVYNDVVAGTLDLLISLQNELCIADIKTTSVLHKESLSWQLSIYAYLYGDKNIKKGYAFHFDNNSQLHIVEIPLKPIEEVEKLIECERQGTIYKYSLELNKNDLMNLEEAELLIKQYDSLKKEAEAKRDIIKQAIITAMKDNGLTSFENDKLKITYVAPIVKKTIDSKKLKAEQPDLYEKYSKETTQSESIRITLKGEK